MHVEHTKRFAEEKLKSLPDVQRRFNLLHIKYMIKAVEELSNNRKIDVKKLQALAWVHDIGKIENDENHAELSVKILEREFKLDETDRDCILNHGSSGKPVSKEARIFQCADGISLFYPEIMLFRFWAESKEGLTFEQVSGKVRKIFEKYVKLYSNDKTATDLLKKKYAVFEQE